MSPYRQYRVPYPLTKGATKARAYPIKLGDMPGDMFPVSTMCANCQLGFPALYGSPNRVPVFGSFGYGSTLRRVPAFVNCPHKLFFWGVDS